ncbi:MAG TPA: AMIN domain-containing protein, partial [Pseudomonadales bacterium]|nr:AMIN domain-containing protein [Pseudomonadales bacterium]
MSGLIRDRQSRHPFLRVLVGLSALFCLALCSLPGLATETSIESVRVRPSPERTRMVFDLSQPVQHQIFSLSDPDRLVIDIDNAKLDTSLEGLDLKGTPIEEMRASPRNGNDLRVVLDLKDKVKPRSFVLKPIMQYGDRLVIDLYTAQQQEPEVHKANRLANQMRDVVVAIDAGHGGDDPGAIGKGHLYEKTVTLAIAKDMAELVDDAPGFTPLMIRQGDYFLAL